MIRSQYIYAYIYIHISYIYTRYVIHMSYLHQPEGVCAKWAPIELPPLTDGDNGDIVVGGDRPCAIVEDDLAREGRGRI